MMLFVMPMNSAASRAYEIPITIGTPAVLLYEYSNALLIFGNMSLRNMVGISVPEMHIAAIGTSAKQWSKSPMT